MTQATLCAGGCGTHIPQGNQRHCPACKPHDPYQSHSWKKLAAQLRARDKHCLHCGSTHRLTAHHLIPKPTGPDQLWNLVLLCASCHSLYEAAKRTKKTSPLTELVDRYARRAHDYFYSKGG